jgi:hypothetical protein
MQYGPLDSDDRGGSIGGNACDVGWCQRAGTRYRLPTLSAFNPSTLGFI